MFHYNLRLLLLAVTILSLSEFVASSADAINSDQKPIVASGAGVAGAKHPPIPKEQEILLQKKLEHLRLEQEKAERRRNAYKHHDVEDDDDQDEDNDADASKNSGEVKKKAKPSKLILEKDDDLAWQWKYVGDDKLEPKKKAEGGAPSKGNPDEDYDDFFNTKKRNKKRQQKIKPTKKPKKYRKNAVLNPKEMRDAYSAGLPSVIIAHIDEKYAKDKAKAGKVNLGKQFNLEEQLEINVGADEAGKYMCQDIAKEMALATDIEAENSFYNDKQGTCIFQVIMDQNADDVIDWLSEQKYITSIEYNAPMDKIDPNWSG